MEQIAAAWRDFQARRFPTGAGGEEVGGIDLADLDGTVAGCITTYLSNRGRLDPRRTEILQRCVADLETLVSVLAGDAHDYFQALHRVAAMVLSRVA